VTTELDGRLRRISPATNRVTAAIEVGGHPDGIAYAFGAIWVADPGNGAVVRVDTRTNRVTRRIRVARADWITPSADSLWVSAETGRVSRIDPTRGTVTASVAVGANPLASAFVGGELWVPNLDAGTVSLVDPASSSVQKTLKAGREPLAVASVGGDAWVSNSGDGELWRLPPSASRR
jgi:YVTN family beta-propeller protein